MTWSKNFTAISCAPTGGGNNSVARGVNCGSAWSGDIDATMKFTSPGKGIGALTKMNW